MHALVIGGLGFIGHALCAALRAQGHDVTTIDNINDYGLLDRSELNKLSTMRMEAIGSGVMHYRMDINQRQDVYAVLDSIEYDACIFLAAYPRMRAVKLNPSLAQETMVTSLHNLLKHAKLRNKKFMFVSSSMVYGSSDSSLKESTRPQPNTLYGRLKLAGELATQNMLDDCVIVRPTGVYGPLDVTDRVISKMMDAAIKHEPLHVHGHDTIIDVTYISDVIKGILLALPSNGVYNISTGQPVTLNELAQSIISICNSRSIIQMLDHDTSYPLRKVLDCSKARDELGYAADYDLKRGLQIYHDWLTR